MGFSLGFGSKKGKSSQTTTTDYDVSEVSATDIFSNAFRQATSTLNSTEQQTLNSLLQTMGISNEVQQQFSEQLQQQQSTTTGTSLSQQQQATQTAQQTTGSENVTQNQQTTGQTQESATQTAFADQDIAAIRSVLPAIFGQSMQNFELASGGNLPAQIAAIQRQLSEQILPGIVSQEGMAGAYNSTATAQLANDAIARGAERAALAQVESARTAGQAVSPVMQLAEILKGAETGMTGTTNVLQQMLGQTTGQTIQNTTGQSTTQQQNVTQTQEQTNTLLQNILNTLTNTQQQTQQTQTGQQTGTTTGSQTQSETSQEQEQTSEDTTTDQEGSSKTVGSSKSKSSGFSLGFG